MQDKDLHELQSTWEELAKDDPLWAILSVPSKKGRKWNLQDFFNEGKTEVDRLLHRVSSLHTLRFDTALDFGCGVGRVTQPLANHFRKVVGIDISLGMIDLARQFNKQGEKVEYCHNPNDDLAIMRDQSFDFVYSNLVLQHMKPAFAKRYINEFFRITRPDGVIVFQVPSHFTEEYLPKSSGGEPLPPIACRAQIRFVSGPTNLNPGQRAELQFQVTNLSREEWLQGRVHSLNLGNHWLSDDRGSVISHNDGRSRLPGRLTAGQATTVRLLITAPQTPGRYHLEVDVVQEGIRWFKDSGSATLIMPIRVTRALSHWFIRPRTIAKPSTSFMMEGIPRNDILQMIDAAGARLLTSEEHVTDWYSYKYYIAR